MINGLLSQRGKEKAYGLTIIIETCNAQTISCVCLTQSKVDTVNIPVPAAQQPLVSRQKAYHNIHNVKTR